MEGKQLSHLTLGERLVTVARLLAAEHVRQELENLGPERAPGRHVPTLTQLVGPAIEETVQQYRYVPTLRSAKEAA